MEILPPFKYVATLTERHFKLLLVLVLLSAVAGIITDWFIGGYIAVVAGRIQFICLVIYFLFAIAYFLFKSYGPKTMAVLETWPLVTIRVLVFIIVSWISIFFIGFTVVELINDS